MTYSTITESYMFLSLLLTGGVCGAVFGVIDFRIKNRGIPAKVAGDAFFIAFTALSLFFVLEKTCGGDIRFYHVAGFILGFSFVKALISRIITLIADILSRLKNRS